MSTATKKIVIITGSTAGLGYQCALRIATEHPTTHRVVIASRNLKGVQTAVDSIQKALKPEHRDAVVACAVPLDLTTLDSVKSFADWATQEYPVIDSLVLNAGTEMAKIVKTKDGVETVFAVNHLSHFYLTQLLLSNLLNSENPRLVVVSSFVHNPAYKFGPPRPSWTENSPSDWAYGDPAVATPYTVYPFSKLCNVLFAYELRNRVADPRLAIVVFDPGFCRTTSFRRNYSWLLRNVLEHGFTALMWIRDVSGFHPHRKLSSTEESGNLMASYAIDDEWAVYLGSAAAPVRYFSIATETSSSVDSYNKEYQRKLWEFSEAVLTGKMGGDGMKYARHTTL
ncbi:hypothetical protein BJ742DRAFT_781080 [Cladochytrium replicatum]|nr:hypothetical protein BJ742DRAFT_781080 [Cladochytrium replicatum]